MSAEKHNTSHTRGGGLQRLSKAVGWTLLWVVGIFSAIVAAAAVTLTPERLGKIAGHQLSDYVEGEVKVKSVRLSFWQSWPHVQLEADSISVVSRTLHKAGAQAKALPADADSLLSLSRLEGSVNVAALLLGRIEMGDVTADSLRVNLVVLNDSVNNFSIIPPHPDRHIRFPYITARSITLKHCRPATFYSAPDTLRGRMLLGTAAIRRERGHDDDYSFRLGARLFARFAGITICDSLPITLDGHLGVDFSPLALHFSDVSVGLARLAGRVNMDMDLGDTPGISSFDTRVSSFQLLSLLNMVPPRFLPDLQGVSGNVSTQVAVRLTRPYRFASGGLPWLQADITVPSSQLTYRLRGGREYRLDNLLVEASLLLNGDDWRASSCTVRRLAAHGEGLRLSASGNIARIFDRPDIRGHADVAADMPRRVDFNTPAGPVRLTGRALVSGLFHISPSAFGPDPMSGIDASGSLRVKRLSVEAPAGVSGTVGSGTVAFNLGNGSTEARASLKGVDVLIPSGSLHADAADVSIDAVGTRPGASHMKIDRARYTASQGDLRSVLAEGIDLCWQPGNDIAGTVDKAQIQFAEGTLLTGYGLDAQAHGLQQLTVQAADVDFDHRNRDHHVGTLHADVHGLRLAADHPTQPGGFASLQTPQVDISSSLLPQGAVLTNVDATYTGGCLLTLRHLALRSGLSAFSLTGSLLRTHRQGQTDMLTIRADLDVDTLQFNQLARSWQNGSGHVARNIPEPSNVKSAEFLTPDNIDLLVHARAKAADYTNLHLTDLEALFEMRPGEMALDTLSLQSNFGHAALSMHYDCTDPALLRLGADFALDNLNLQRFFESYPNVLAMMPEMGNLHGVFAAHGAASTEVFPSMQVNMASLIANVGIDGKCLYVHQNPFIRRMARMALIFEQGDIYIPNIHVDARVFDELLTLYPFNLDIGNYHLRMMGRNDFNGDLDYHLSVLHNPLLPFRFGVNMLGHYSHPKLRFGGAGWSEERSFGIDHINNNKHLNLIQQLRRLGVMLMHHAAEY